MRHCNFLKKGKIRKLYNELGDNSVYEWAKLNNVEAIVAHALMTSLYEGELPSHWIDEYKKLENKILSYIDELNKVADLLAKEDIPLIALKNSGITIGMYPYYGSCPMGDIDVLVKKSQFRKAHQILINRGYILKSRFKFEEDNIDSAELGGGAEYSVKLENEDHLWFELQWRPVAGRWIQPKHEPSAEELFQRSIPITGSNVRLLSPEDNLIQVALHTAKHSFVRAPGFRLHTDVDRIISSQNIDWRVFQEMVLKLKVKTAVYMSLSMARDLLGTSVPSKVMKTIQPNKLKLKIIQSWLIKVGVFEPESHKWSKVGYIVFVSLLYDSWSDFISGIFPPQSYMKKQYKYKYTFFAPYYYYKRLFDILFKRAKT